MDIETQKGEKHGYNDRRSAGEMVYIYNRQEKRIF